MMYPLVIECEADGIPVMRTCRVLGFSPQAFYKWCAQPCSDRDWDDAHLVNMIIDIHSDDPEFGYRFICDELHKMGVSVTEGHVQRLCHEHKIFSVLTKKGRKRPPAGPPAHDDLVKRDFSADRPNALWLTDLTEHPTAEGKLYLCAVKDVWSNRIVGYSIAARMTASLAERALKNAIVIRDIDGELIVHSDRGGQFRSRKFTRVIDLHELRGSMGQVGSAGDNAAMESFFSLLQLNVLNRRKTWDTREELRAEIVYWIEATYHRRRKQRRLGKLTPIEFETIYTHTTKAA
jgi:transposase InsO family protein